MDFSVLADRDCLVAFAAVVLCSDRGAEARVPRQTLPRLKRSRRRPSTR
jgi:hypothetical protein